MGNFQGTKGKWIIKHSISKDAFNIVGTVLGGNYKIARIPYLRTETLEDVNEKEKLEAENNAKLIACAPEMLETLMEVSKHHQGGHSEIGHKIKDIIKKATE